MHGRRPRSVGTVSALDLVARARQDLSFAARQFRRSPLFSAAVVLSIGGGIWLATIVTAMVLPSLRPTLRYANTQNLTQVGEVGLLPLKRTAALGPPMVSRAVIDALRAGPWFSGVATYQPSLVAVLADDSQNTRRVVAGSHDLFQILGVAPMLGRSFAPTDDAAGGNEVVLGYDFWKSHFGGDSSVVGTRLALSGAPAQTIVGVMPPDFVFPPRNGVDLYVPLGSALALGAGAAPFGSMIGRLRPGVSLAQLQAAATLVARQHAASDRDAIARAVSSSDASAPQTMGPLSVNASRYVGEPMVQGERAGDLELALAGAFVLLIAGANVANLLLIRITTRQRGLAVRMALGASRARIVEQLVTEAALLSIPGGALGIFLAWCHVRLVRGLSESPQGELSLDWRVGLGAVALSMLLVLLFASAPAVRGSARPPDQLLRGKHARSLGASRMDGLMSRLVTLSLALTVVLVVGATLSGGFAVRLMIRDPGFGADGVALAGIFVSDNEQPSGPRAVVAVTALLARAESLPGVAHAAIGPAPVHQGLSMLRLVHGDGRSTPLGVGSFSPVSPGYFATLRIPLVAGRTFSASEASAGTAVAVVGASTAARLWPGRSALGQHARVSVGGDSGGTDLEIVGVAADLPAQSSAGVPTQIYVPFAMHPDRRTALIVRGDGDPSARASTLVRLVGQERGIGARESGSLTALLSAGNDRNEYAAQLFAAFGLVSLVLVAIGLYGVIAFAVAPRTREIGIRLAIGATRGAIIRMILLQGAKVGGAGMAIGVFFGIQLALVFQSSLWGAQRATPLLFAAACALVGLIALIATYIPARRAARLDAIGTLGAE